ncbi:hypothetical protein MDUV_08890 [Mycolicibacterium duvalii]|uniref:Uncharacterized protein n=1 Tax=Mycolicibacterium duvalii TaxID=39688 RepID=A0A7I7JXS0_9MYCO|nr:hypothetical protein MDUV_08890 [Mycolicibacterium duvalii]
MYRTIVRVTKNVTMNAKRQQTSGSRVYGIPIGRLEVAARVGCTRKTYADQRVSGPGYPPTRRGAPIVWSAR